MRALFAGPALSVSEYRGFAAMRGLSEERGDGRPSLTFIRRGTHLHHAGGVAAVIEPGSCVLYRGDAPYRLSHPFIGAQPDESLFIEFDRDLSEELFGRAASGRELGLLMPPAVLFEAALTRAAMAAHRMDALEGEERAMNLLSAASLHLRSAEARRPPLGARGLAAIRRVREIVATGSSAGRDLPSLAGEAQCTPFHLTRLFKRATGMSISRYRLHLRLARVLDALEGGEDDLTRLAIDAGFSDHAHMSNSFRKTFGRTPSAVRAALTRANAASLRNFIQARPDPAG